MKVVQVFLCGSVGPWFGLVCITYAADMLYLGSILLTSREYLPNILAKCAFSLPWTVLLLPHLCRGAYKIPEQWPNLSLACRAPSWSFGSFSGLLYHLFRLCSARLWDILWSFEVPLGTNATVGFWRHTAMLLICIKINRKANRFIGFQQTVYSARYTGLRTMRQMRLEVLSIMFNLKFYYNGSTKRSF